MQGEIDVFTYLKEWASTTKKRGMGLISLQAEQSPVQVRIPSDQ